MPNLITWDIDTNSLDLQGLDTALQDKLEIAVPSQQTMRLGFYRGRSGDTRRYLDIGEDPGIEFLIKPATGDNRFDTFPVVASPEFTRQAVDDLGDYYYEGSIDFSAPVFIKALGINVGYAQEVISIECLANTSRRLDGRYVDVYDSATTYKRFWFETTTFTVTPPAAGTGGTLVKINVANNATASTVATALETAVDANITCTSSTATETLTITFTDFGMLGVHSGSNAGFEIVLVTCGSTPEGTTDDTTESYNGQLVYLDGTAPQLSPIFTLQTNNSLYRDNQTFPAGTASSNSREGSVTLSATDTFAVTFSSALASADWTVVELNIVYTGGGDAGLKLVPTTIEDKAADGFTVWLNGDATTDYQLDYKVTL